jgi:hypothetical protein
MAQYFDATLTLVHIYDPAYTYAEAQEASISDRISGDTAI